MKHCFHCKKQVRVGAKPSRNETCPYCSSDLKVCLNCRFFNPQVTNQCSEPMAELVVNKKKANFCEYFQFAESTSRAVRSSAQKKIKKDPLKDLKRLFTEAQ